MVRTLNLLEKRKFHTNVKVGEKFIFSIGGNNDFTALASCEKFDISNEDYQPSAELNYERSGGIAVCQSNQFIFCFGGWNEASKYFPNTIEKFDVLSELMKWVVIDVNLQNHLQKFGMNGIEIENGILLIFGGQNEATSSDLCYVFNKDQSFSLPPEKLMKPANFSLFCLQPIRFGYKIYSLCSSKLIHTYDIINHNWELINFYSWAKPL